MTSPSQPPLDLGPIDRVIPSSVLSIAHKIISRDLLLLGARVALGTIFFMSARTKVDGFLSIRDATYFLFEHEYALPLIPVRMGGGFRHLCRALVECAADFWAWIASQCLRHFVNDGDCPSLCLPKCVANPLELGRAGFACCVARWGSVVFRSLHGRKSDSAIGDLIGRLRCRIRLETNGKLGKTLASKLLCGVGLS